MPALNLRLDEDTHALILVAAASKKQSLAKWIAAAINAAILHQAHRRGPDGAALGAELDRRAAVASRPR